MPLSFYANYLPPAHLGLLPVTLTCLLPSFCNLVSSGFWFSSLSYATYLFISEVRGLTESCLHGFLCSTKHLLYVASSEEVRRNSWSCLLVLSGFSLSIFSFFFFFFSSLFLPPSLSSLPLSSFFIQVIPTQAYFNLLFFWLTAREKGELSEGVCFVLDFFFFSVCFFIIFFLFKCTHALLKSRPTFYKKDCLTCHDDNI